jgi:spore coat protein CotH
VQTNYSQNYVVALGNETQVYAELSALITAVSTDFSNVSSMFDLTRFLRFMPIEWLTGNPDSYSWRGNNWWLLFADGVGRFVPYDQEESFGLGEHISDWQNMTADVFFNCQNIVPHIDCGSPHLLSQMLLEQNRTEFLLLVTRFVDKVWLPSLG